MRRYFLALVAVLSLWLIPDPAPAANRFAVCATTCTWDGSSTAMWSTSSGGGTGASVPGASDAVILDAATCVGGTTCTITLATNPAIQQITSGACTASTTGCVFDNTVNNNNITLTAAGGWNNSGSGTRVIKLGSGTVTLSSNTCSSGLWTWSTTTGLTFTSGTSTINFSGTYSGTSACSFSMGGLTYNNVSFSGAGNKAGLSISGANTYNILSFTAPGSVYFPAGVTTTIATLNISGSTSSPFLVAPGSTSLATLAIGTAATLTGVGFRAITVTGITPSATGWDFGQNTNITITPPSAGGGATGILRPGVGQ